MSTFFKLYVTALVIFFAVDMVWLGLVAKKFYADKIGFLLSPTVNWAAAIVFYLLFVIGLVVFVILPAVRQHSWSSALFSGALFGLVTYAAYDLTNLATVKNWPLSVTVVDLAWGMVLGSAVSALTYIIYTRFLA